MKLDQCKRCYHFKGFAGDTVVCRYWGEKSRRGVGFNNRDSDLYVLSCPRKHF